MKLFFVSLAALLLSACATHRTIDRTHPPIEQAPVTTTITPPEAAHAVNATAVHEIVPAITYQPPPLRTLNAHEVECMATAMYHEARGEGEVGMIGVGYIIAHRMENRDFPDTACKVVYQGKRNKAGRLVYGKCQFGWACKGPPPKKPADAVLYERAKELAKLVMLGYAPDPVVGLLYFHEYSAKPNPKVRYAARKRLGNHLFYAVAAR